MSRKKLRRWRRKGRLIFNIGTRGLISEAGTEM